MRPVWCCLRRYTRLSRKQPTHSACADAENADPQRRLAAPRLPNRDLLPRIAVQAVHGGDVLWATELHSITDDLESRYLAAKGDELAFTIDVPGKGAVDGVLWCVLSLSFVPLCFVAFFVSQVFCGVVTWASTP